MAAANFKPIELLGKQVSFIYEVFESHSEVVQGTVTQVILSLCENYQFCVNNVYYSPDELISFQILD